MNKLQIISSGIVKNNPTFVLVLFAGIRERLDFEDVPKAFKGIPIALITAGILAMAFMGFSGLV